VLSQYTPMAPTQVREPFHREGWIYEEKIDGWRMLAYKDGDRVRLISRNGRDHTRRFAGIAAAVAKLSTRALALDGEFAIYDEKLRSRASTGSASPTQTPSLRRPCSSCSISCITKGARSPGVRSANAALGWRMPSPTTTWSSRYYGSRRTACRRGRR
jgi:ATP dependent DNA ligase domain